MPMPQWMVSEYLNPPPAGSHRPLSPTNTAANAQSPFPAATRVTTGKEESIACVRPWVQYTSNDGRKQAIFGDVTDRPAP